MGRFIWHEWARFVSISASIYLVWAAIWGIMYRKFFFDFVDHGYTNTTPPIPTPNARFALFVAIIEKIPLIQIAAMVNALFTLAYEFPLPFIKGTFMDRNFTFKAVNMLFQSVTALLFYQGTNSFLWGMVGAFAYARAVAIGEIKKDESAPRGGRHAPV